MAWNRTMNAVDWLIDQDSSEDDWKPTAVPTAITTTNKHKRKPLKEAVFNKRYFVVVYECTIIIPLDIADKEFIGHSWFERLIDLLFDPSISCSIHWFILWFGGFMKQKHEYFWLIDCYINRKHERYRLIKMAR